MATNNSKLGNRPVSDTGLRSFRQRPFRKPLKSSRVRVGSVP